MAAARQKLRAQAVQGCGGGGGAPPPSNAAGFAAGTLGRPSSSVVSSGTPMSAFKTYDIRGRLGTDLTEAIAHRIAAQTLLPALEQVLPTPAP